MTTPLPETKLGVHIVILQRGWVFAGYLSRKGRRYTLRNAQCIRVWGTTRGLGEIAFNGPTASTRLDPSGEVKFHELTAVGMLNASEDRWARHLN